MKKNNLAIIVLLVLINASIIGNIIFVLRIDINKSSPPKNIIKIAWSEGSAPAVLDPVDSWDSVANDMIRHVCDTLWVYNLMDPTFPLEMRLAINYSWNSGMDELTVSLRDDVLFHDGAKFNATAVKFTFDRIMYFINWSGDLHRNTHVCDPAGLFSDMYNEPILNRTEIIDKNLIKFVLNKPNGVFLSLLTYEACSILHPKSTNATEYLVLGTDILVGTGPFEYVHIMAGEELKFERFDLYWGSNTFWDEIIWVYYPDTITANNAMLGGEVDYLRGPQTSLIPEFQADPVITFVNLETSPIFRYWSINNRKINNTNIRKAIAYAYNYTHYIEVIRQGFMTRAEQFLPPGFPYYNASFKSPYHDTGIARQAMLDAAAIEGWNTTGLTADPVGANTTNDANWASAELVMLKVLEHEGWSTGIEMNEAFRQDLDTIGITLYSDIPWDDWYWYYPIDYDNLEIFHTGWRPDYLDPFNMIEPLLNNMSGANHLQLQDPLIHKWLEQYEKTNPANTTKRAQLLYRIQQRAINELYILISLTFDNTYYVHHRSLGGVSYNIMNTLWLADSYYIPNILKT